jgi:hypothetical protein
MHSTIKRPRTEPYDIWCARRKIQKKELKQYLKGRPVWISMQLIAYYNESDIYELRPKFKRRKIQGTYVMPLCPLCQEKEKYCKCIKLLGG